jgi:hypothetical protein
MLGRGMIGWLTILLLPTIGLGQSDRLQVYFKGKATLSVSGDVPSCGFFTSCPLDESYCSSFWDLFIALLEHEKSHRKYYTARISRCDWEPQQDPDSDSLPSWWERMHGLDPRRHDTTGAFRFDPDGDSDAVAEIEAFGALERAKKYWRYDWAQYSMQWGIPPSPFPWRYVSSGTNISRYDRYLLRSVPRTDGR